MTQHKVISEDSLSAMDEISKAQIQAKVKAALDDGTDCFIIAIQGGQGSGKSTFLQTVICPMLFCYHILDQQRLRAVCKWVIR